MWPRRDSNTQPSDLESDALPLRHGVKSICIVNVLKSDFCQGWGDGSNCSTWKTNENLDVQKPNKFPAEKKQHKYF